MIGNDIIDLAVAKKESNWERAGFLQKIFTEKEQNLILSSKNPEILVWNLWSRKEAAYKIYNRITGIRAYIPHLLECFYENEDSGTVKCRGYLFFTKTMITGDKIHTVAVCNKEDLSQIELLEQTNSIQKINGIPFYIDPISQQQTPVSISNHGRYSACVVLQ
jgi:phosphopantetheinyl transferase (holo-ACP synthase)